MPPIMLLVLMTIVLLVWLSVIKINTKENKMSQSDKIEALTRPDDHIKYYRKICGYGAQPVYANYIDGTRSRVVHIGRKYVTSMNSQKWDITTIKHFDKD
jgi:hypothetical protein